MNERLSAFLDGEASSDDIEAVLAQLLRDETTRDSWSRQNWIRTTLRAAETEKPIALDLGFSNRSWRPSSRRINNRLLCR